MARNRQSQWRDGYLPARIISVRLTNVKTGTCDYDGAKREQNVVHDLVTPLCIERCIMNLVALIVLNNFANLRMRAFDH